MICINRTFLYCKTGFEGREGNSLSLITVELDSTATEMLALSSNSSRNKIDSDPTIAIP